MKLSTRMENKISLIRSFWGVLTIFAFVLCSCTANCPTRNDVLPLDLNQFTGEWFLVAGTPATGKSMSKCGNFAVSSTSMDTFIMNYTALTHRYNKPVALMLNGKLEDDVIANLQLRGSNRTLGPYNLRVIAAEYDSYFVMVICAANNALKDFSMILSRSTTISSTVLMTLKNKLSAYVDRDVIVDVDHRSC